MSQVHYPYAVHLHFPLPGSEYVVVSLTWATFPSTTTERMKCWERKRGSLARVVLVHNQGPSTLGRRKRRFYSENASNVFRSDIAREYKKQQLLVIFDLFSKKSSGRELPWLSFSKRSVFVTISVDGRPNRRNKAAFSDFFCVVWTELNRWTGSVSKVLLPEFLSLTNNYQPIVTDFTEPLNTSCCQASCDLM